MADGNRIEQRNTASQPSPREVVDAARNQPKKHPRWKLERNKSKNAKRQESSRFGEWKELIAIIGLFLLSAGAIVVVVTRKTSQEKAAEILGPAGLAMFGAMISTVVLYSRWKKDFAQREMIEHNRIQNENRRLELQELSKRREALGTRLATAINHLSSTNGFTQVAGLTELGGIADDWWNLGIAYGAVPDKEGKIADAEGTVESRDITFGEIQQRRQEIVTLIFCHKLPKATESDSIGDKDRQAMVQRARADLLRRHTDNVQFRPELFEPSSESWCHLNLDGAWLKNAQLADVYLGGTSLIGANLQNVNLISANLQGADLFSANLQHATLFIARLKHAYLRDANLQHAELRGANLQHAELRGAYFQDAVHSDTTTFPTNFEPDEHGLVLFNQSDPDTQKWSSDGQSTTST